MPTYEVQGTETGPLPENPKGRYVIDHEDLIDAPTPHEAVRLFHERHGFWPESIDGILVNVCEACEAPILEGEEYGHDPESGVYGCEACCKAGSR